MESGSCRSPLSPETATPAKPQRSASAGAGAVSHEPQRHKPNRREHQRPPVSTRPRRNRPRRTCDVFNDSVEVPVPPAAQAYTGRAERRARIRRHRPHAQRQGPRKRTHTRQRDAHARRVPRLDSNGRRRQGNPKRRRQDNLRHLPRTSARKCACARIRRRDRMRPHRQRTRRQRRLPRTRQRRRSKQRPIVVEAHTPNRSLGPGRPHRRDDADTLSLVRRIRRRTQAHRRGRRQNRLTHPRRGAGGERRIAAIGRHDRVRARTRCGDGRYSLPVRIHGRAPERGPARAEDYSPRRLP